MLHAVWPLLAATTKPSSVKISAIQWVFIVLGFSVGVVLAEIRRWRRGVYPWRLHSIIWGLFLVITGGLAVLLLILAWFTTRPRPYDPPPRSPGGRLSSSLSEWLALRKARRGGPAPSAAAGAGTGGGVVPGTYGTSLPPHEPPPPPPLGQAAGWLPDPTGRHEHRYWNGSSWSRHVADGGQRSVDEL